MTKSIFFAADEETYGLPQLHVREFEKPLKWRLIFKSEQFPRGKSKTDGTFVSSLEQLS